MAVVVFFGAHADDIELGAGGTCAKLCAAGFEVHIVIGTDEADQATATQRRLEAITAACDLGVPTPRVHFLGLPDGRFRCENQTVSMARALLASAGLRPDCVFTHGDFDSHQDHVEMTRIVRASVRQAGILKYTVRNSAIVSHFHPTIFSAIDDFTQQKSQALCKHNSQVVAGRVSPETLAKFAHRYAFSFGGRDYEGFELEVQEGADGFAVVLDRVNDAPLSRLWQPLLINSGVRVFPGALGQTWPAGVSSRAPGGMTLISRLQSELSRLTRAASLAPGAAVLTVEEMSGTSLDLLPPGSALVMGGPDRNPLARRLIGRESNLALRVSSKRDAHGGQLIFDARTRKTVGARYTTWDDAGAEIVADYGLLTMVRRASNRGHGIGQGPGDVVISAASCQAAGVAAAFSCLTRMEHIAAIVADAREVIDGRAAFAQWLIPCDAAGNPQLDEIRSVLRGSAKSWALPATRAAHMEQRPQHGVREAVTSKQRDIALTS